MFSYLFLIYFSKSLIICKDCWGLISSQASECPQCGCPGPSTWKKKELASSKRRKTIIKLFLNFILICTIGGFVVFFMYGDKIGKIVKHYSTLSMDSENFKKFVDDNYNDLEKGDIKQLRSIIDDQMERTKEKIKKLKEEEESINKTQLSGEERAKKMNLIKEQIKTEESKLKDLEFKAEYLKRKFG